MGKLAGFLMLAVLLSVTPGPDALLVLRSSVRHGRRLGLATAAGAAAGSLAWALATVVGLAAVMAQSADLYRLIRLAGAAYLIFLGVSTLISQARARTGHPGVTPAADATSRAETHHLPGPGRAFGTGLLSDLLNPKVGIFYLAIVPQFIPSGVAVMPYSMILCGMEITVALTWLSGLAWLAQTAAAWLHRPAVDRWLQRTLGVSLIAIGATVATER